MLPAFLYLAAIGVALALIDVDVRRLPDSIVFAVVRGGRAPARPGRCDRRSLETTWPRGAAGLLVLATLMFVITVAFPNTGDMGSVRLAGLLGLYLGWLSWPALLVGVVAAVAIAGIGGSAVAATGHGPRALAVPLATLLHRRRRRPVRLRLGLVRPLAGCLVLPAQAAHPLVREPRRKPCRRNSLVGLDHRVGGPSAPSRPCRPRTGR